MKTFTIASLLMLTAVSAHACPDLSGTYDYSPDGSITLTIAQQACTQITFTTAVEGSTISTEVDQINGQPQAPSNGTSNTFEFKGDSLIVTPVDATGAAIPGSYSTYALTASKDIQYSLDILVGTPNQYNDVTI
jgi:hypothetical protein